MCGWVGAWRFIRDRFLERMVKKKQSNICSLTGKNAEFQSQAKKIVMTVTARFPFFQTLKSYRKRGITQAEKLSQDGQAEL